VDLFAGQRGAVGGSSADTRDRQGRVLAEDLSLVQTGCETVENDAHRDAGAADACLAMDHIRVRDDEVSLVVGHSPSVGPGRRFDEAAVGTGGCSELRHIRCRQEVI
jgi:hypothetical protein